MPRAKKTTQAATVTAAETPKKIVAGTPRPPIVVIMGHVDHGKTTLLDYIRKTNVAAKESGGITQHIGAYEIGHAGKQITFLDTPGHEAFSKMRTRGATIADIAILVVAAEEGVKPQTIEAISQIKTAQIPYLVAVNKMDKPGANPDKVKQELATADVLVEEWGGKVPIQLISAKTGDKVDQLLDLILLMAELEALSGDPAKPAEGVVIESHLDPRRGPTATLLIRNGTLKKNDPIIAGNIKGKIKILENFRGELSERLSLSSPARVLGWDKLPEVGAQFFTDERALKAAVAEERVGRGVLAKDEIGLILKADVTGSLEALEESIQKLAKTTGVPGTVLEKSVGEITESDMKLADATGAMIISFRARISREAESFNRAKPQKVIQSDIIYKLLEDLEKEWKDVLEAKKAAEISGRLEVLGTFGQKGEKQIIGGKVIAGKMVRGTIAKIIRRGSALATGKISNLQMGKQDTSEVAEGSECGILFDSPIKIAKGDILEISGQSN